MTGLVRKATLLLGVCGVLAASSALGDVPRCENSGVTPGVYPAFIRVVGINTSGQADPAGEITLTIRDGLGNLLNGARVSLDFSACCDINICNNFTPSPNPYFQEVKQCTPPVISARTDPGGVVKFRIVGSAKVRGTEIPIKAGSGLDCLKIRLGAVGEEIVCDSATAVAFDLNGAVSPPPAGTAATDGADVGILLGEVNKIQNLGQPYMGRDDLFSTGVGAGVIDGGDVGEMLTQVNRALNLGVGSTTRCPSNGYCTVKVDTPSCHRPVTN